MRGFQPAGARPQKNSYANGGPVRGKGTGTSDEVPDAVPEGTYIMPTDSTHAIGEQNLAAMGKREPVPVNLSNGEFKLPPEQVHAIGVQALDQMKGATHTPVAARGFAPGAQQQAEPPLFFVNGGVVDDEARRRVAPYVNHRPPNGPPAMPAPPALGNSAAPERGLQSSYRPNFTTGGNAATPPVQPGAPDVSDVRAKYNPANGSPEAKAWQAQRAAQVAPAAPAAAPVAPAAPAVAPQGAGYRAGAAIGRAAAPILKAAGSVALPATLASTAGAVGETPTSDYETRFGFQPNTHDGISGFARDVGVRTLGAASDLGDAMTLGMAGKFLYADKQANAAAAPVGLPAAKPTADTPAPVVTPLAAAATAPPQPQPQQQPAQAPAAAPGGVARIDRPGHSPLFTDNADPNMQRFLARPPGGPNAQNMAAANAMESRSQQAFANQMQREQNANQYAAEVAQAQAINAGNGRRSASLTSAQERERKDMVSALATVIPGARGITAAQTKGMLALQGQELQDKQAGERNDTIMAQTALSNKGSFATAKLREAGDTGRAVMREVGETGRAGARNAIDQGRLNLDQQVRGFDIRSGERQEALYQKYEGAKTPEDRAAVAQQIRDLSGKADQANRFTVVSGGQEWDQTAGTMRNVPGRVLNNQTGQFVDQPGAQRGLPPLKDSPQAQAIVNNAAMPLKQRQEELRKLGYN